MLFDISTTKYQNMVFGFKSLCKYILTGQRGKERCSLIKINMKGIPKTCLLCYNLFASSDIRYKQINVENRKNRFGII